jgi:hypothetical protein
VLSGEKEQAIVLLADDGVVVVGIVVVGCESSDDLVLGWGEIIGGGLEWWVGIGVVVLSKAGCVKKDEWSRFLLGKVME